MCLAVPLEVSQVVDNQTALVKQAGTTMEINISLLQDPKPGDFVIVHAGFGIEILDFEEAEQRLDLFRQVEKANRADEDT